MAIINKTDSTWTNQGDVGHGLQIVHSERNDPRLSRGVNTFQLERPGSAQ